MKITDFMRNIKKDEQKQLVVEFEKSVLDYYSKDNFLNQSNFDNFVIDYLLEDQIAEINQLIDNDKFTLLNILRSIKKKLNPKFIVFRDCENGYDEFYYKLRTIFEKILFENYIRKQYEEIVYLNKVKKVHLTTLLKYKKKVLYNFIEKDVEQHLKELSLDGKKQSNYLKVKESYSELDYLNDQILDLIYLFNENTFTNKDDIIKIINNKKYKYIILPFEINAIHIVNEVNVIEQLNEILKSIEREDEFYLITPKFSSYNRYLYWSVLISQLNKPNLKIGIILNEYELIYEIEEAPFTNLIIINYDEICVNNYEFRYFKEDIEQKMRLIKQIAKENDIKVVVKSNNLKNETIIEKLIIMGFKSFIYNENHYNHVKKSVLNYMSRRGKYRLELKK